MRAADYIVDIGPGAGVQRRRGRRAQGTVEEHACKSPTVITGQYLSGQRSIPVPRNRRKGNGKCLTRARRARRTICKNMDVDNSARRTDLRHRRVRFSGKSSLVNEILYKTPGRGTEPCARCAPGAHDEHRWASKIWTRSSTSTSRPSGARRARTRRPTRACSTTSATLFATTPDAKARGYGPSRFSLQCQGRPLRGLLGRRPAQDRDALPAGCLCAVRRVQGHALQPRDARGALQGQEHLRSAGYDSR